MHGVSDTASDPPSVIFWFNTAFQFCMLHSQRPERLTTSYYSLPEKDVFGLTQTSFITLVPKKTSDKQYKFTGAKGWTPPSARIALT